MSVSGPHPAHAHSGRGPGDRSRDTEACAFARAALTFWGCGGLFLRRPGPAATTPGSRALAWASPPPPALCRGLNRAGRSERSGLEVSCLWSAPGRAEGRAPSGRGRARGGGELGARRARRGMRRRAPPSSRAAGTRGTSARAPAGLAGGGSHGAGPTTRAAGWARGCKLVLELR